MKTIKNLLTSAPSKAALATAAFVASSTALAQEGNEAAVQEAIDGGLSLVQLATGGVIAIAAVCMGVFVVTRLIGR